MSLQKRSWSINALAVEFDLNRRTCAKRLDLAGVNPIEHVKGAPKYRLREAAQALRPPHEREQDPPDERKRQITDAFRQIEFISVRGPFSFIKDQALVLSRRTRLTPEKVLSLLDELIACFRQNADELFCRPNLLRGVPLDLCNEEMRTALLKTLHQAKRKGPDHDRARHAESESGHVDRDAS